MKKHFLVIAGLAAIVMVAWAATPVPAAMDPASAKPKFGEFRSANMTADHTQFKELQKPFTSGSEVTEACLTCHTEAAAQIQKTLHWKWLCPAAEPEAKLGKGGNVVNNFCISIQSNEPRCTSCHIGYGYKDKNFDFTAEEKVDCLVCHEQTGTYKKFPTKAGEVVKKPTKFMGKILFTPPDWNKVAQSVGLPTRKNCGTCHFFGGGGEGVKHGDMDASLFTPDKNLDVHMALEGENFSCIRCHTTVKHSIAGRCYKTTETADTRSLLDDDRIRRITCYSCHSETPHKNNVHANEHADKVACQTCHIPEFARKHSTKMYWDWSTAGKKNDKGKDLVTKDADGRPTYHGKKGNFRWEKNVQPEYMWYDGRLKYTMLEDTIDPSAPVQMNFPTAQAGDENARIFPFKVHRGKQPYDAQQNRFVVPHLFGKDKNAYWKSYDWDKAIKAGMEYTGLPYSGDLGWVDTEYVFQTTHMVAPKDKALDCAQCHSKEGRLGNIDGVYIPGRDTDKGLDLFGWGLAILALLGVAIHGVLRFATGGKKK